MSFVKLENLNDFIQPSTSCIKPTEKTSAGTVAKVSDINLSDCLACSGCITSAETVLVQQQNHEELFKVINDNKISKLNREIVVSLSLQSISSLANKYSLSAQEAAERIASFLVSIGCSKVYDINLARHLALAESYQEYKRRRASGSKFPIISSICPGWICYAEKTNGDLLIPHLSSVRSPQQIMGALVKKFHSSRNGSKQSDIYHVTLMPCFDKKLEASRKDFKDEHGSPDVDCVLTPLEFEEILKDEDVTLMDFDPRKLDRLLDTGEQFDEPLTSHFGSVSGGYAENILLAEASEKSGTEKLDIPRNQLNYTILKNNDFIELTINNQNDKDKGGDKLPDASNRFAIVNGFRNIQTIVQRLKRNALKYDYIEIMACPSGCINGGAQCKPAYGLEQTASIDMCREVYRSVPTVGLNINDTDKLYSRLELDNEQVKEDLLHTEFHPVPKMQNLTVSW